MSKSTQTVTFRLNGEPLRRLVEQADEYRVPPSRRAKQIVQAALQDELALELLESARLQRQALDKLREDVARTLVSILDTLQQDPATGKKRYSIDELRQMVGQYLGRP